ncbi:putative dipeptidyl-aminopeptidase B [Metarhizium anisopliae]|nr:putative dipeptidyl-aminopeptidase B [Metarhizium anisopliae]
MAPPFTDDPESQRPSTSRFSQDSLSSVSTTSLVFDRIQEEMDKDPSARRSARRDSLPATKDEGDFDENASETGAFLGPPGVPLQRQPMDRGFRRILIIIGAVFVGAWLAGLGIFVLSGSYKHESDSEHDPDANSRGSGKAVTMDQVFGGFWSARSHSISWIADPDGGDGLLLEVNTANGYLVVEDVRADKESADTNAYQTADTQPAKPRVLMKDPYFMYNDEIKRPDWNELSPDLKKVLLAVNREKNWRHSFQATYFILDVETAQVQPLVPDNVNAKVQLANWSPTSDAISFTMDNNIYIRRLNQANDVVQITKDGGPEYFYGIPDWVYEEEVFAGRSATWWSDDGKYLAFLRTNETAVPEYAIEYYIQRPSGKKPAVGEEAYPEIRKIKYPKPGAHNPVVDVQYYDVSKGDVFSISAPDEFPDHDRIISNVLWAGNKVLLKQSNRIGDFLKVILVDPSQREAKIVNSINIAEIDGGWFEISHTMTYIPADPSKGRQQDGYVDTVIHEGYEHIGYFTPIDNPKPIMLTSGSWEVEDAPSAVDLNNNLVYFVATKESSIQRHVYSVKLDGTNLTPLTNTSSEGYYTVSFSSRSGFALLSYKGPKIPYQKVISTPSIPIQFSRTIEDNADLADKAKKHELPILKYGTLQLPNGISVNYLERRPPHFNPKKKYPILFQQYSGPKSQTVTKKFAVDFQSYVASSLGYLVVTIDPRGTGFLGRQHRVVVRSQLGVLEAQDHIAAAKHYSSLPYVDPSRLAIWGWSYGGFQTLKTLEADAGDTFSYGMAVAPVTDWRFYDSIYTERYMRLPQDNTAGYDASAVRNATALGMNKRFLIMHGSADDNVHFQNSLKLLDYLDLAGIENYDVHVFPDSDHGIAFHGANRMVYDRLNNWLVNAFNGEWLKIADPKPIDTKKRRHVS